MPWLSHTLTLGPYVRLRPNPTQAFAQRVKEHVGADLYRMGYVLVSYTVAKIFDSAGYMEVSQRTSV